MTTSEVADVLGITKQALSRMLKKSGMRMRLTRRGATYLLSADDISEIQEWRRQQKADHAFDRALAASIRRAEKQSEAAYMVDGIDLRKPSPPLPIEYLADIDGHWDEFYQERRRRELRLLALIRASGLRTESTRGREVDLDVLDGIDAADDLEPLAYDL
ncbi:hypothetical protein [Mycobacteroides abscessus]|uniref:hypothetical protein n=1 Tax=Mycobacteroides abscessus TaxID=36809 RepID=UPI00105438CF|nr:hypothetical protein [Mycobacteroides abscessus]